MIIFLVVGIKGYEAHFIYIIHSVALQLSRTAMIWPTLHLFILCISFDQMLTYPPQLSLA